MCLATLTGKANSHLKSLSIPKKRKNNSRMQGFAVMNLSVSLRKWCHIEKYGWLPLVAERCSLVASQFWWGKVHFVELMDVLHLCFYVILHVDLMPWSLHPLLMQNAYTFQPYSGLVYRISVHEGYIRPCIFNSSPNQTLHLSRHTRKPRIYETGDGLWTQEHVSVSKLRISTWGFSHYSLSKKPSIFKQIL